MNDIVSIYKNATAQLQTVINQTPSRIKKLNETLSRVDLEEQDLLHLLEIENFNASQGYNFASQIKKVREKRRKVKMELDALYEIRKLINNNSKLDVHMNSITKEMNSKKYDTDSRKYHVRVRTDLKDRFEKVYSKRKDGET